VLYTMYETAQTALAPWRAGAEAVRTFLQMPGTPHAGLPGVKHVAAGLDVMEQVSRRRTKPDWRITETTVEGHSVPVHIRKVVRKPFGDLVHFERDFGAHTPPKQPRVLVVAPMSGHFATLLRGTVEALLPHHDVYVTDWRNARDVHIAFGRFDFDHFSHYLRDFLIALGPGTHMLGVCQPGPACLVAASTLAEEGHEARPSSVIVMGSPIDARRSPTVPNHLAQQRTLRWFQDNLVMTVPLPYAGTLRRVYPGFIQLNNFISMNADRHVDAHWQYFEHLVEGDRDSADKHRAFYDEYLSVMDLTEEFYIQTVDEVFQRFLLAEGTKTFEGRLVRPEAMRDVALMTVEGEHDDISGIGQTQAAHDICVNVPDRLREDYIQPGVGHYGVFNGRRWREEIRPRISDFIAQREAWTPRKRILPTPVRSHAPHARGRAGAAA